MAQSLPSLAANSFGSGTIVFLNLARASDPLQPQPTKSEEAEDSPGNHTGTIEEIL